MCRKNWTQEELEMLVTYINVYGRKDGLEKFSSKTGRSVDAGRRKLLRTPFAPCAKEEKQEDSGFIKEKPGIIESVKLFFKRMF